MTSTVRTTSTRPAKVLVVDDEEPIRTLVRGYLERERFEALTAADGPTALEMPMVIPVMVRVVRSLRRKSSRRSRMTIQLSG